MTALKPYRVYRNSGVRWLGKVPEHWEVTRARYVFREIDRRSRHGLEQHLSMSQELGLVPSHLVKNRTLVSESYAGGKLCDIDDLVLNRLKAHLGVFALARYQGIVSPDYTVLRLKRAGAMEFFERVLRSSGCRGELRIRAKGIVEGFWRLYTDDFNEIKIPDPPVEEQVSIARYLDHADARIRRYIGAKEKLLALLEEQKRAVIHEAVTGRIDIRTGQPYPAYKDSGVEWLGKVPEHWEVRRLKSLATICTGGRDTNNRKADGRYPFFVRSQTVEGIDTWSFDGEAVLTAGDGVGVGKVFHYVNGKFDFHQRVYKFSDFRQVTGPFFFHYFRSTLRNEVRQGTAKSTVDSLRLPMLQNFSVALPPVPEQVLIVEHLDDATDAANRSIELTRRQIALAEEYRTRLISDVVTGKLDVREAAAELPGADPTANGDRGAGTQARSDSRTARSGIAVAEAGP